MSSLAISPIELTLLQPPTDSERHDRAVFFVSQISRLSLKLLTDCLHHCDGRMAAGTSGSTVRQPLTPEAHQAVVKELTALSIWLAMECQARTGMEEWLEEFFQDSWFAADRIYEEPTSRQVLEWYPAKVDLDETCSSAALRLSLVLGVSNLVDDAIIYFADAIKQGEEARAKILHDALWKTPPERAKIVDEPI